MANNDLTNIYFEKEGMSPEKIANILKVVKAYQGNPEDTYFAFDIMPMTDLLEGLEVAGINGYYHAYFQLYMMYDFGLNIDIDKERATTFVTLGAECGNEICRSVIISSMIERAKKEIDAAKSKIALWNFSENPEGKCYLGMLCEIEGDFKEALVWYKKSNIDSAKRYARKLRKRMKESPQT